MAYPQDAGLSALMGNYGNISAGMNPGQQPSWMPQGGGGSANYNLPTMPSMDNMPQAPAYQPQDWGGFAPGQLNAQYGTANTYGANNYGYGVMPAQAAQVPTVANKLDLTDPTKNPAAAQAAAEQLQMQMQQGRSGGASGNFMGNSYSAPSTQSTAEGLASTGVNLGSFAYGIPSMLGNAYINSRLSDAATQGGYTGTYTGDAAFGNRPNNVAVAGQSGPLSGGGFGPTQGNNTSGSTVGGDGGNSGGNFGGGFGGGDAVGGYYANGQFNQPAQYANGGIIALLR